MHFARTLRRALRLPLPGSPEARAFEAEYSQSRARLGITGSSALDADADADDEADEEEESTEAEQERMVQLWRGIMERQTRNSAMLCGVVSQELE
jgi:hypothetical protein